MHVTAHTLVDWESEDYPQTVCIRPEMHEEHCVYAKSRQSVTCLHSVVFSGAGSPWVSSLPLRATGSWGPRSFVVGVLSVDLGLHCCVYAPSRTVGRHHCVLWSRCSWCLRTASSFFGCPLGVSWSILVSWVGFFGRSFGMRFLWLGFRTCSQPPHGVNHATRPRYGAENAHQILVRLSCFMPKMLGEFLV